MLVAFDLLELDGADLRRKPIEEPKRRLARLLRQAKPGLQLNAHLDEPGDVVFRHALKLGLEFPMRRGSRCQSGRWPHWIKSKNPEGLKKRLQEFGVREVDYPDKTRFFFQAPGGQVFRLAPLDGGL